MSAHVEELFSPERLRQNWLRTRPAEAGIGVESAGEESPRELLDKLTALLQGKFPAEQQQALEIFIGEARSAMENLKPAGETGEVSAANRVAALCALDRLEDLLEVLEATV